MAHLRINAVLLLQISARGINFRPRVAWFLDFCRKRRGRCFHEAAFLNVVFLLTLRYNFDACVYIVQSLQGGSEEEGGRNTRLRKYKQSGDACLEVSAYQC